MADMFSGLPDELLVNILSFLPIKDAVKTSVFSIRWRNLWKFMWNLDIQISHLVNGNLPTYTQLINFLSSVQPSSKIIKLHVNDIPHVSLWGIESEILNLITKFSTDHQVENLALKFRTGNDNFITRDLFHIKTLVQLEIEGCCINLADQNFVILPMLKTLVLRRMYFPGAKAEEFISNCSSLEFLEITIFGPCTINHSNLRTLFIKNFRGTLSLKLNTPSLKLLKFRGFNFDEPHVFKDISSLIRCELHDFRCRNPQGRLSHNLWSYMLNDFGCVKTIYFNKYTIQDVIVSAPAAEDQPILKNSSLVLEISWTSPDDIKALIKMLSFFPQIERLELIIAEVVECKVVETGLWITLVEISSKMKKLKVIDIQGFINCNAWFMDPIRPCKSKIMLVEVFWKNLAALEKLRICVMRKFKLLDEDIVDEFLDAFEKISCSPKASSIATMDLY